MKTVHLKPPRHDFAICSIWQIDMKAEKASRGYYYIPDNFFDIIIGLKGHFSRSVVGTNQKAMLESGKCYMTSARSKGTILRSDMDFSFLVIKLFPNYQKALMSHREFDVRNSIKEFSISQNRSLEWDELIEEQQTEKILGYFCDFLDNKLCVSNGNDSVIEESIDLIKKHKGEIKVKEINDQLGVCKSTLEDRFNKQLGLSPKEFCKIEKINNFLLNYQKHHKEMTLTQLTFKSGYYDQSHLIKDFKYFVDLSPRKYFNDVNRLILRA